MATQQPARRDFGPGSETSSRATTTPGAQAPATADPGPLGLAAFALTTFMLSLANAGLFGQAGLSAKGASTVPIVVALALAYGGLAQLLAGMWEFRAGNTFGAVAFTSFGAFWLSYWVLVQFLAKDITSKAALGHGLGMYLISWGIFTAYMTIASLRTTAAISLVFLLLTITFFVLGFGDYHANKDLTKIGGYFGIATAIAAWYASFAAVTNSTFGKVVLPVIPLKRN